MLFINSEHLEEIKEQHYNSVRCIIWKRLGSVKTCDNTDCSICTSKRLKSLDLYPTVFEELLFDEEFLRLLILGLPEQLLFANELFVRLILDPVDLDYITENLKIKSQERDNTQSFFISHYFNCLNVISKIIDYDGWFVPSSLSAEYNSYILAEKLNRRSCTYCNRTFTTTMCSTKNGKLMRPQFDHWFSQSKYPLLGLSFYNLIPCCSTCNSSVKGKIDLNLNEHIHPYLDNVTDEFEFKYEYKNDINNFLVDIDSDNKKLYNTLKILKIDRMYNSHIEELKDLILTKKSYSKDYLNFLKISFPDANLTESEIYRLAFGVELDSESYHKIPLSKFKKDILRYLKII